MKTFDESLLELLLRLTTLYCNKLMLHSKGCADLIIDISNIRIELTIVLFLLISISYQIFKFYEKLLK